MNPGLLGVLLQKACCVCVQRRLVYIYSLNKHKGKCLHHFDFLSTILIRNKERLVFFTVPVLCLADIVLIQLLPIACTKFKYLLSLNIIEIWLHCLMTNTFFDSESLMWMHKAVGSKCHPAPWHYFLGRYSTRQVTSEACCSSDVRILQRESFHHFPLTPTGFST